MFLDVGRQFLGMSFLQSINSFIVIFKFGHLLFEILTPPIKLLPNILEIQFHVLSLLFVLLFEVGFFFGHSLLEDLIFTLALPPLLNMLILQLLNLLFQIIILLNIFDLALLIEYNLICLLQNDLHFFLVGVHKGCLVLAILFVLRMEMEDDLGQLCDLFRHFVVGLVGRARTIKVA